MEQLNTGPPTPGNEPVKECPKAQAFEVHPPHLWEKKEGWALHCDGILPVDEQPPCQFYVSPSKPECGEAAPTKVRVKTPLIDAVIDVCAKHKRTYDSRAANLRASRRATQQHLRHAS